MQHLCVQVLHICTESPHYTRPLPAPFSCSIGYALENLKIPFSNLLFTCR